MTKLDVLDGLDELRVCVGYRIDGEVVDTPPMFAGSFGECAAVYENLPGWKESTVGAARYEDLPRNAQRYLARLEELVGIPVTIISTGPDRDETIIRKNPFS